MSTVDELLGEFIDAWNAGERPDVEAYLERAPEEEHDELAGGLAAWLHIAPTPAQDRSRPGAIWAEPALRAARRAAEALSSACRSGCPTCASGLG